jgi:carbohydrate kinase (thermoresistant glucokinase family)
MTSGTILVMGVSGSGKSTVGRALATRLGRPFLDADDLHPPANVAKMSAGIPLTDADRAPWLRRISQWLADRRAAGEPGVLACSALKRAYRDRLRATEPGLRIAFLAGEPDLLAERLGARHGHFFPARLLQAQLADLEVPGPDEHAMIVFIGQSAEEIVDSIAEGHAG